MISNFDEITTPAFSLGNIVSTHAAAETVPIPEMLQALKRHASCDWGDLCDEDKAMNDHALRKQGQLMSVYETKDGARFWIITEWDRSATTILLPNDD